MAQEIRDETPAYAAMLAEEANELQEQATALESANNTPASPPTETSQPNVQLQEQIQPKKDE